ncbi:MAG: hypothetical protein KME43_21175 [Myxacorys chilensis ATA2-1-KO14]|nr:hypothetical protein [Myxacorys chilensis ATA2-1-KO14]
MKIVICPGMHSSELTEKFVASLDRPEEEFLIFPSDRSPVYSPKHVLEFLQSRTPRSTPLIFIGFSAGVVGAIAAAHQWHTQGGIIRSLIAIDGWSVPLFGNFPIHRLSHDYFTHWSSALLGSGTDSFYADPPVEHLDLWQSPQTVTGHRVSSSKYPARLTATTFLTTLLDNYSRDL